MQIEHLSFQLYYFQLRLWTTVRNTPACHCHCRRWEKTSRQMILDIWFWHWCTAGWNACSISGEAGQTALQNSLAHQAKRSWMSWEKITRCMSSTRTAQTPISRNWFCAAASLMCLWYNWWGCVRPISGASPLSSLHGSQRAVKKCDKSHQWRWVQQAEAQVQHGQDT